MSKSTEPSPPPSAEALRARRARALRWRFAIGVGLPTLLAVIYYLGLASPQYDATATLAIESAAHERGARDAHVRDASLLADQLRSRTTLDTVDGKLALLAAYRADGIDFWSRLRGGKAASLRYFQRMVDLEVDRDSGAIALRARAFAPATALALAEALVECADAWIATRAVAAGEQRLPDAAAAVSDAEAALRSALATGELGDAVAVEVARQRVTRALADQATLIDELARTRPHLIVVRAPSVDDEPSAPRRAWAIATVAAVAFALVSIASLLLAAIREHASH